MSYNKSQHQDEKIIFRKWITKNGKRIYAEDYGLKAFPIHIKKKKHNSQSQKNQNIKSPPKNNNSNLPPIPTPIEKVDDLEYEYKNNNAYDVIQKTEYKGRNRCLGLLVFIIIITISCFLAFVNYNANNTKATPNEPYYGHSSFDSVNSQFKSLANHSPTTSQKVRYVGSVNSNKYHYPSCSSAKRIDANNLVLFYSIKEAEQNGYVPCQKCFPGISNTFNSDTTYSTTVDIEKIKKQVAKDQEHFNEEIEQHLKNNSIPNTYNEPKVIPKIDYTPVDNDSNDITNDLNDKESIKNTILNSAP